MGDYNIWAIKGTDDDGRNRELEKSLKNGTARFGWSYVKTADLKQLQQRIDKKGWDSLTDKEKDCYQPLLLEVQPGDWWVYVNVPERGKCCAALVTSPYKWLGQFHDFNHSVATDRKSFFKFDRQDAAVPPYLRARLMLMGRKWRIYAQHEFERLLEANRKGRLGSPYTEKTEADSLSADLQEELDKVTALIQKNYPHRRLELLLAEVFKRIPGTHVTHHGGPAEHGADLIVEYEDWLAVEGLLPPKKCLVQIKAYEGKQLDTGAVEQIERAFKQYPDADMGLIVSTASKSTPQLDAALDKLREKSGKPVGLLIGRNVATFVFRWGLDVILQR